MKLWRALTISACLPWAASGAMAQDNSPNLLALPTVSAPARHYPLPMSDYNQHALPVAAYEEPAPHDVPPAPPGEDIQPGELAPSHGDHYPGGEPTPAGAWGPGSDYVEEGGYGCCDEALNSECCEPCISPWFGSIGALYMTRDRGNKLYTTYETNNNPNQLMHTQHADSDWAPGAEATIGRRFGCDHGIAFTFWGLDEMDGSASQRDLNNNLSTPLDLGLSTIGPNLTADYFDNAREHRIERENNFYNMEINFLRYQSAFAPHQRTSVTWLAGARWFRFDENLLFGSVAGGSEFGANGGADEAYLDVDVENNLIGFQVGARGDYRLFDKITLFATPKIGIYGNHITHHSQLYSGDGLVGFDIQSSKNDVAMLGSIDLGAEYQLSRRWSVYGGYRAIGVTGVALSDNQIPFYMVDAAEFEDVDSNGSLILHGAFLGLQCNF